MTEPRIAELVTEAERAAAFPVVMQLWEDAPREFTRAEFVEFVRELEDVEGYRLFGLFVDETPVCVAGASIRMSAWYGRYLWVDDLVTDAAHRSNGYGEQLLSFLERWATARDCETVALASALEREGSHRFYERQGMNRSSYVFTKSLP